MASLVTRLFAPTVLVGAMATPVVSQDLETIGKSDPIKINGGLSLNQIFYAAHGKQSRRDPYSYFLTGNIAASLYGWSVPLSFSVSNQNRSFQQPFNQFSVHPRYKWITAHAGYTSMSFSPYTLNGHIFRGVGVELTPNKFHFDAMCGVLQRAVAPDSARGNVPAFRRNGFGFKGGYRDGGDYAEMSFFHSQDDASSLSVPPSAKLLPEENVVMGISIGKSLVDKLAFNAELASSVLTRDTRVGRRDSATLFERLFDERQSTSRYNAYKGGLHYHGTNLTAGLGFERIDPNYRTHGAYYFNNDLESFTVDASGLTSGGKLSVNGSVGVQHDNLDGSKMSSMRRFVGSLNVTYRPVDKLSLSGSYSNFQSYTNIRSQFININQLTPYDNLDTLKFTQITQSINLNGSYSMQSTTKTNQMVSGNLSMQDAAEHQSQVTANSGCRFYNLNTFYSFLFIPSNWSFVVSYNACRNESPANRLITMGPSLSVNKGFLQRKLRVGLTSAFNNSRSEGKSVAGIFNMRMSGSYVVAKRHNLNLGLAMVQRTSTEMSAFQEYTGTLSYSYSF